MSTFNSVKMRFPTSVIKKCLYWHQSGVAGPKCLSKVWEDWRGQAKGKQAHPLKLFLPPPHGKSGGPSSMGVVSKKIQGADKSSFRIRHIEMAKKGEEDRLPGFSLCKREERFPLADEGKGPFNIFFSLSLHCGGCQTRWGSLPCLPSATSRNKWSKSAPSRANFFSVRLEPAGRRGVVSPNPHQRYSARVGAGRNPGCPQRTTFWFPF